MLPFGSYHNPILHGRNVPLCVSFRGLRVRAVELWETDWEVI
jgi:hypothetical protein